MIAMAIDATKKSFSKGKGTPIKILHGRSKSAMNTSRLRSPPGYTAETEASLRKSKKQSETNRSMNKPNYQSESMIGTHSFNLSLPFSKSRQGGRTVDSTTQEIHVLNLSAKRKERYEQGTIIQRPKSVTSLTGYPNTMVKFQEVLEKAEKNKQILQEQLVLV